MGPFLLKAALWPWSSPGVPSRAGCQEEGGGYFTVMTPLCGASLKAIIDDYSTQPYSLEEALLWGVELAIVLHTLHSRCRLFHGDISARNVLLGLDRHVYVADLGLAEHNHPYGVRQGDDALVLWRNTATEAPEMQEGDMEYDSTAEVSNTAESGTRPCSMLLSPLGWRTGVGVGCGVRQPAVQVPPLLD
jgi:hypothetical protein